MHCTKSSRSISFKHICNISRTSIERLLYNEDLEVGAMLYDRYERIFEIVLDKVPHVKRARVTVVAIEENESRMDKQWKSPIKSRQRFKLQVETIQVA